VNAPMTTNVAQAWTTFWAEQGPGSRCLARASEELLQPLDTHWHELASGLLPATEVLDLACGAGAVGRELLEGQPDLHVTGIDIALIPPSQDHRIELVPWTPMESLPFGEGTFDAAVSQFGYEYGQTAEAASEVARVLAPGAPISLLLHHSDSPLVEGMRLHKRALEGLCSREVRETFIAGNASVFGEQIARLKRQCPGDPIIDQAAYGLQIHIRQEACRRSDIWKAVDDAMLMIEAEKLCADFAQGPTVAFDLIKRALDAAENNDLATQLDLERQSQREAGSTNDYKGAVRAFLDKRKPTFTGKR